MTQIPALSPAIPHAWLTTADVAGLMGLERATVARSWRGWGRTRGLPPPVSGATLSRPGGRPRWLAGEIAAWLARPGRTPVANDARAPAAPDRTPPGPVPGDCPPAHCLPNPLLAAAGRRA